MSSALIPICTPNARTFGCDVCHKPLYDCFCPRSITCRHCELDQDDAEPKCDASANGVHEWVDENGELVPTLAEAYVLAADAADLEGWTRR